MVKYYKYYFQQLAINDAQIASTEAEPAFFYVKDIYNPDAFDKACRSLAKTPAILLERYRSKLSDGGNKNYQKKLIGRFNVVVKTEQGNEESIDDAYETCEAIAEDLLAKMREELTDITTIEIPDDSSSPKLRFPYNDIEMDDIGPIDQLYYGKSVSFYWETRAQGSSISDNWPQQ